MLCRILQQYKEGVFVFVFFKKNFGVARLRLKAMAIGVSRLQ